MAAPYVPGADDPAAAAAAYATEAVFRRKSLGRSWSSNSSSSSSASSGSGDVHRCICAPPTHPGSFKCRIHRNNAASHHHAAPAPPSQMQQQGAEQPRTVPRGP